MCLPAASAGKGALKGYRKRGANVILHASGNCIASDPKVMFGKPVVMGTRVSVDLILPNS